MRTMTNAQCTSPPYDFTDVHINSNMICAADPTDINKNFCVGDRGAPLITNEGKFYSVIGN